MNDTHDGLAAGEHRAGSADTSDPDGISDGARTLARGSVTVFGIRAAALGMRLLLSLVLAQAMGASGYGAFSYSLAWLSILIVPGMCGLDQVIARFIPAYRVQSRLGELRGVVAWTSRVGLLSSIATALLFATLVALFPSARGSDRVTMALAALVLPLVVGAQLRQAVLRAFDRAALAQLPENLVYPIVFAGLVWAARLSAPDVVPPQWVAGLNVVAWAASFATGAAVVRYSVHRHNPTAAPALESGPWRSMLLPLTLSAGAYQLFARADIAVLGGLFDAHVVGVYAIASRSAELMAFVYEATLLAGTSVFSRIYATGDMKALQQFTNVVTRSILWISLPAYPLFFIGAPWFLGLFGPEFVVGVPVVRILISAHFISGLGGFVLQMLYVMGHERSAAAAMGAAALLNIILSMVLVPRFASIGAAYAAAVSLVAMKGSLVCLLYARTGILAVPFASEWRPRIARR